MQNPSKTSWKVIVFFFLPFAILGCTKGSDSFDKAISFQKKNSINYVPKIGEGLSFFKSGTLTPTWQPGDIAVLSSIKLTGHQGRLFPTGNLRGKISVIAFFFTSCHGFCPILVNKLKAIEKEVGVNDEIQFVAITVDPEFDTPQRLIDFGRDHGFKLSHRFMFLTGQKEEIHHLVRDIFSSEIKKIDDIALRKFAHTEHFYIVDQKLRLRSILNGTRIDLAAVASTQILELIREENSRKKN